MSSPVETVRKFVASFTEVWPTGDASTLSSYFDADATYHNGPMEPIKGRDAIVAKLATFMKLGGNVGVDIVHMVAEGPIVMNERRDHFIRTDRTISLPVMGIFEVHVGTITAWRDYFDLNQFSSQL